VQLKFLASTLELDKVIENFSSTGDCKEMKQMIDYYSFERHTFDYIQRSSQVYAHYQILSSWTEERTLGFCCCS
jgi:preprotein translocase subunit Sec63